MTTISHEIRTQLNAVLGMATLLMQTPLTQQQRNLTETIHSSGDTFLATINDILDF